jgi:hypothetical protein
LKELSESQKTEVETLSKKIAIAFLSKDDGALKELFFKDLSNGPKKIEPGQGTNMGF